MTNQFKFCCRILSGIAVIAAVTVGSGYAQTVQPAYAPPQTQYVPSPAPKMPAAMRDSVADAGTPCGGDFGMLGKLEEARHGVTEVNPSNAPVCD
jgi:hypothetical protein